MAKPAPTNRTPAVQTLVAFLCCSVTGSVQMDWNEDNFSMCSVCSGSVNIPDYSGCC